MEDRKFICPCYRHEGDIAETGHCICHHFVSDDYEPVELESPPIPEEGNPWPGIVVYGAYWCKDTINSLLFLNRHGIIGVATLPSAATPYFDTDFTQPVALILGAEDKGLGEEWQAHANRQVHVPMHGKADSLNVGTTAALVLYEAVRQRRRAANRRPRQA